MQDKLLLKVKEILFKSVKELADSRVLPYDDAKNKIYLYFTNNLGKHDFNEVIKYVDQALKELIEKEYLNYRQEGFGPYAYYIITKGLDFNKGIAEMENKNESNFNIQNLTATNIQVGNNNVQNVNYTAEEFIESLVNFEQKTSEERKSILSKISESIKDGASLGNAISKFISMIG